jgi:hypothetical protein
VTRRQSRASRSSSEDDTDSVTVTMLHTDRIRSRRLATVYFTAGAVIAAALQERLQTGSRTPCAEEGLHAVRTRAPQPRSQIFLRALGASSSPPGLANLPSAAP